MSQAVCFECEHILTGVKKPMEELINIRLPLFCNMNCSMLFPDNGTPEFEERLQDLAKKYNCKVQTQEEREP